MAGEWGQILAEVVAVVRDAGKMLRAEFHRAGGPRGGGEGAPIDQEVERLIRERLLALLPHAGYRGEETGSPVAPQSSERLCWLVDPNDGTRAFLSGQRGSAVSIALLRRGAPVLGVVYAYNFPDDEGDLFAWAEAAGAATRNGRPLEAPAWPAALAPEHVVLVTQLAEHDPADALVRLAPARFRALPSLSYRMALVAAGEGVATISLGTPQPWDHAAGHALLRAVGGAVLDERGQPLAYGEDGQSAAARCFAGAPAIAADLAARSWDRLGRVVELRGVGFAPPCAHLDLVKPLPDAHVADPGLLARAQGCLLGQVGGDALGAQVEFRTAGEIRARWPGGVRELRDGGHWDTLAGQPTDDSELALMLARGIAAHGRYDPNLAAQAYVCWYLSSPFDVGMAISRALSGIPASQLGSAVGLADRVARQASLNSQANGSLMRCSPLGIYAYALPRDQAATLARLDSRLTHPHEVCRDACAAFVVALAHAIRLGDGPRAAYEAALRWAGEAPAHPDVLATLRAAAHEPPADYQTRMGWVRIALQNAFYQLLHAPSLEEALVDTVGRGGDTDTNAAIAGALLGAVYGRQAVPERWCRQVLSCHPVNGLPQVHQPRPRACWPVDLLVLAERLLIAGRQAAAG